jgi:hypothetical protein
MVRLASALALLAALSPACARRPARPRAPATASLPPSRVLDRAPARPKTFQPDRTVGAAPFAWSGGGAALARRGTLFHDRIRLVADVTDAQGGVTEFLVDTGTSDSFVATESPAAATARVLLRPVDYVVSGTRLSDRTWAASLPVARLGDLGGRDVPVYLVERGHSRADPGNILGLSLLSGLALEHDARTGRWRLDRGGGPGPGRGRVVRLEEAGLPVVAVVDERGRRVHAMVDTGAPWSLHDRGGAPGRFRVLDAQGRTALVVDARVRAPWSDLRAGGRHVRVWIGLDALDAHSFRLDFATGAWTFPDDAATPGPPTRRAAPEASAIRRHPAAPSPRGGSGTPRR